MNWLLIRKSILLNTRLREFLIKKKEKNNKFKSWKNRFRLNLLRSSYLLELLSFDRSVLR